MALFANSIYCSIQGAFFPSRGCVQVASSKLCRVLGSRPACQLINSSWTLGTQEPITFILTRVSDCSHLFRFVASPEKTEAPYITNVKPFQRCWAKGSRNKWLESHVPPYASARNRSPLHGAEYAASVVREFVAKFSWYLRMEIEPTPGNLCLESSLPQDVLQLKQAALERLDAVRTFTPSSL